MLCSQAIWLRLSADLERRRSQIDRLSALLDKSLSDRNPELKQKICRVAQKVRASKLSFQLLVDLAHPMQMTDENIQEFFARPDFRQAACSYHDYRQAITHELQLWELPQSHKRDALFGMALSLFRQCEGLVSEQERALALCQIQTWVEDGVVHYSGEPESVDASESENQS